MEKKSRPNSTRYGEFIPTYYAWTGLERQKEIVERLENITEEKEK